MAKKSIQEFYAYFVDNLQADATLHYLRNRKWLTPDEYDTLKSGQMSRRQKAEKLLLLLPRKVTSSYDGEKILVDCIIWSGQGDLVKNLGYSDNEISVIKGKNPSGTSPVPDSTLHINREVCSSSQSCTGYLKCNLQSLNCFRGGPQFQHFSKHTKSTLFVYPLPPIV